jgi:hypothetical protein
MQKNVEQRKVEQILPNASSCMANDLWQGENHNITIHILCDGSKEGPRVGMMMLCNNVRIVLYLLDICLRIIRWWNQFDHSTSLKYGWVVIKLTNPLVIWCLKHFCQLFLVHKVKAPHHYPLEYIVECLKKIYMKTQSTSKEGTIFCGHHDWTTTFITQVH